MLPSHGVSTGLTIPETYSGKKTVFEQNKYAICSRNKHLIIVSGYKDSKAGAPVKSLRHVKHHAALENTVEETRYNSEGLTLKGTRFVTDFFQYHDVYNMLSNWSSGALGRAVLPWKAIT